MQTLRGQESATGWEVAAIVREEVQVVTALTGGRWTLEVPTEGPAFLSIRRRDALRHFLAEALMNTWKHAGVAVGELELRRQQDEIVLGISDRGCGFDPATSGDREAVAEHYGQQDQGGRQQGQGDLAGGAGRSAVDLSPG